LTGRLMIDRELVDDFYRAYAYFRWADDVIDTASKSDEERIIFIKQQRELIDSLYDNKRPSDLTPEEGLLADLINHDTSEDSGLQSFIRNMFAIIEFDAYRKGWSIGRDELEWYSNCLAKSVTDGIQYFIGNGHSYPDDDSRLMAATGAHIAHLLRDTIQDTADGFVNIPAEYLEMHGIQSEDVDSPPYRAWVRGRVEQARSDIQEGKRYLDELEVLRCKIAGYWYCARFEGVLDAIERDGYHLRADYNERRKLFAWLRMGWLATAITVRHVMRRSIRRIHHRRDLEKQARQPAN
ncbi:MAG: squalene/phytoene synthase family protein, partial [Chloroflexota bacterium]